MRALSVCRIGVSSQILTKQPRRSREAISNLKETAGMASSQVKSVGPVERVYSDVLTEVYLEVAIKDI